MLHPHILIPPFILYFDILSHLQKDKDELISKLGVANGALDEVPSIEFQNLGLSIDGEEKNINQEH